MYLYVLFHTHICVFMCIYALPCGFTLELICFKRLNTYTIVMKALSWTHHLFSATDFQEKAEGSMEKAYCKEILHFINHMSCIALFRALV